MAIAALSQVNLAAEPATIEEAIGKVLCLRTVDHFVNVLGQRDLGVSYSSCNAAVAIVANAQYDSMSLTNVPVFSALYGSSRLYTGLDADFNAIHVPAPTRPFSSSPREEHAEQSAILTAASQGLAFMDRNGRNHIYIDLTPCDNCAAWLAARPEQWHVHYFAQLGSQRPVIDFKKEARSDAFGRQMEPRG